MEYVNNYSVYRCTLCGKKKIIDMDEQPPETCDECVSLTHEEIVRQFNDCKNIK